MTSNDIPKPNGRVILVVDDTPMNLKLASDLLAYEGYSVLKANHADEALELLKEHTPDLILMDIQMPGMDGLALTQHLRTMPVFARLPIIALTASAMKGDPEKARAAGCDGYITKPIDTRSFVTQVASALGQSRAAMGGSSSTSYPPDSLNPDF